MENSIFQFKAKPTDHRDKQHAVADFKRALNAVFPRVPEEQRRAGRYLCGASMIDGCEYSLDIFGGTTLTDGQFYKIVAGFESIWESANSALTEDA